MSQSNTKRVLPLNVERVLSKDTILPGTTVNVQIMVRNTTKHPIESLYIIEGDIQPASEVELFPITEIDSVQFVHQGIITSGKQHQFHYSITLHPYSSSEHISIGEMQVSFSADRMPIQMIVPETTIKVENIPVEELEITEGYYLCPNCEEHLELDTVLCTNCGFQINQETLSKIWTAHGNHTRLIEEEIIQTDEETPVQIEEKPVHTEETPVQIEEKPVQEGQVPPHMEIMYLKQAAQAFREQNFEECLLNLKITLQITKQYHSNAFQIANGVAQQLLANIIEYDGKPVSERTAATSLKFVINFVKSLKTTASESSR